MTNLQTALLVFALGAIVGSLVVRYTRFERASHHIRETQKPWGQALQAGALLGAIFAVSYVGVLVAGWSRLWRQ